MLKFYYHPLSPISRRVWLALLEKKVPFSPIVVNLHGEQFEESFLDLNPFHRVPVLVHEEICLIESLAILDYLDRQFPHNSLSPISTVDFARMRVVQMVITNELLPQILPIIHSGSRPLSRATVDQLATCFQFIEKHISNKDYFGGHCLNLADIVAGATIPLFSRLGILLESYPSIQSWYSRRLLVLAMAIFKNG
jgi:glutathione S-transferase